LKTEKHARTITIAFFLILAIASSLITFPTATAAVNYYTSWIYVSVNHDFIGLGQPVLLVTWMAQLPPDIGEQLGQIPSPTGRAGWDDVKFVITKPDGNNETIMLPRSDPVGTGYTPYIPDIEGTYYVQAFFPATWKNTTTTQSFYSAASSNVATFIAQADAIQGWQEPPLPEYYWTRPINTANRAWYVLAANWLAGAAQTNGPTERFAPGSAPESAHIMWSKPYYEGGIMDERMGEIGYQITHYGGLTFTPPIIINGKLYYDYRVNAHQVQGSLCVDLYTGQTLFYKSDTELSFGQIYNYNSPNQHGGFAYLWKTSGVILPEGDISQPGTQTWEMLDANTGDTICYVANVSAPRGSINVYGKDGSILYYNIANLGSPAAPNYYLQVWNSSAIPSMLLGAYGTNTWQWRPQNTGASRRDVKTSDSPFAHDGSTGFSLNVSIPNLEGSIRVVREGEYIIGGTTGSNNEQGITEGVLWELSLESGQEGQKLSEIKFTPPSSVGNRSISLAQVDPEDGMFVFSDKMARQWYGYSLATGQLQWTSEPEPALHYFSMNSIVYQSLLLSRGDGMAGGTLIAYNITTGEVLWEYVPAQIGFESPYGNYPIAITCVADGKIYLTSGEHSPTQPLWRGSYVRCINASNGVELWKVLHWGSVQGGGNAQGNLVVADGFLVGLNYYDNQIYCYGKGPSATTVTASPPVSVHGDSVIVQGTVTDQSPSGRRNINDLLDFSLQGTPAISDEDMQKWMEYLFMQQAYPADAKGVEVILSVLDPNDNCYEVGRTTSDINGNFGYAFEPLVPGTYQIIATFEGSASYYPSSATTYITVEEAPAATAMPTPPPASVADMYLLPSVAGIIIAIVVVGLLLFLMLRRR
jgi:hypothetical protein